MSVYDTWMQNRNPKQMRQADQVNAAIWLEFGTKSSNVCNYFSNVYSKTYFMYVFNLPSKVKNKEWKTRR
jgi:hypothetical protein